MSERSSNSKIEENTLSQSKTPSHNLKDGTKYLSKPG